MHKAGTEENSITRTKEGRLLARILAEDLSRVRGQEVSGGLDYLVTGETRKDWSDPEYEGAPAF